MAGLSVKDHEEALYSNKGKSQRPFFKKKSDAFKGGPSSSDRHKKQESVGPRQKIVGPRKISGKCFRCGKQGHFVRDCRVKIVEGNSVEAKPRRTCQEESEEEWDGVTSYTAIEEEEEELALTSTVVEIPSTEACVADSVKKERINYEKDWIVDSGCSHHMTGDMSKFTKMRKYEGREAVITADNTMHSVQHVGDLTISPWKGGMNKNLVSVPQITAAGNYVVFGPDNVKVLANASIHGEVLMEGKKVRKLYVLSAGDAYVDKARQHETADLWHAQLAHVHYNRLKAMVKGLPSLDVREGVVCAGCQFEKAHRLPFTESKKPTVTHFKVFGCVCYVFVPEQRRAKMEKKAIRCIFVGYDQQRKGWRCIDPTTNKAYVSLHVVFDEGNILEEEQVQPQEEPSVINDSGPDVQSSRSQSASSPWKSGVRRSPEKEAMSSGGSCTNRDDQGSSRTPQLGRVLDDESGTLKSTRMRKPNPRYADRRYAEDLLKKYGMQNCKPIDSPMEVRHMLRAEEGDELEDARLYRQLVGSLIYLTITRPDLTYAVGVVSQFMHTPRKPHLEAVRRIVRYVGFTDTDWAGDPSTRRSTSGYTFSMGSGVVSWCSKKQPTVALSSTEAEYRATTMAAQECTWLLQLVQDMGQDANYTVGIYCDNQSAIRLATNPVFHARTKHIEVHHHYIREKVLSGEVELVPVATNEQVADIFTKALALPKFGKFRTMLGMCTRESVMREDVKITSPTLARKNQE
ncbi:hypothetical protein V2J09_016705 [Rumex salicifolius]